METEIAGVQVCVYGKDILSREQRRGDVLVLHNQTSTNCTLNFLLRKVLRCM